jgi:hypothetical protein
MAVKVTTKPTVTVPKIRAGGTTPYDTPGAEYYAAQGIAAQRIASYQAGNKPYVTATQSEYSSAKAIADRNQAALGLKGYNSGKPPASPAGGGPPLAYSIYPSSPYIPVKLPTAPTTGSGLPPLAYSQAPDPRVHVPMPYDLPTNAEYDAAKAMADNAKAVPQPAYGGGGGGGGGWGGGGDWASQMNWTSQMINWRI